MSEIGKAEDLTRGQTSEIGKVENFKVEIG